ncbi:MAG: hypothetical protein H7A32_02950 [Deltaproteobacteria bacterium]|nr:hypothetical protein [Deltaproteobacteria bacterium]
MRFDFKKAEVNSYLDGLFNLFHSAVLILNQKHEIQYMNHAAEGFFSSSLKTCLYKNLAGILSKEEKLFGFIDEAFRTGQSIILHDLLLKLNEKEKSVQVEIAPLATEEAHPGIIILISEFGLPQSLKEEYRLKDRLSMMGTLSLGLAHEIRNPLGGIRGAAQMLIKETDENERQEYSEMIIKEVDRLNHLLTQMLDFTKPRDLDLLPVNLNQILDEVLRLQLVSAPEKLKIQKNFDPSIPPVLADANVLKQALINLIKNACESMPNQGTLFLQTRFNRDARRLFSKGQRTSVAELIIRDTGTGIKKKNLKSLFTPFFSTKDQGTGLGLMLTQKIIQEHNGILEIESQEGKGTQVLIYLPFAS